MDEALIPESPLGGEAPEQSQNATYMRSNFYCLEPSATALFVKQLE